MDTRELAWASGLFDGEGCITTPQKNGTYPRLQLVMTDEDSVRRFHRAVGVGVVRPCNPPSFKVLGRKPMWRWRADSFENCQAVIAMLWYGLSRRRKDTATYHFNYEPKTNN